MKKSILLLIAIISVGWQLNAQTIFNDDFSNNALPNWTIVNESTSTVIWKWSNTGSSTGSATATFDYDGAANGHIIVDSDGDGAASAAENTSITSKAIDCSSASTVIFSFYEYYARYQGDTPLVFISNDSITWTAVHNPAQGLAVNQEIDNPTYVELDVTSVAAGQSTVYIRFNWRGKFDYWWFVDDVKLFIPATNAVEVLALNNVLSNGCNLTNAEEVSITFLNKGLDSITTLTASYVIDNGTPVTETVILPTPLKRDSVYTYEFAASADLSTAGLYQLTGWVSLAGDTVLTDDTTFSIAISADPIDVTTPYTMGFEIPNIGNEIGGFTWTTLDANNDGVTWGLSAASPNAGTVHFRNSWNPNGTTAANDWLFSPCLSLDANKAYKLSFFSEVGEDQNGLYEERLRVKLGNALTVNAMTQMVKDFGELTNSSYAEQVATFKPATTGIQYLGFQAYSAADKWFLDIDDVRLEELAAPTADFTVSATGLIVGVTDQSADGITSWEWSFGDGTTDTTANPVPHVYAQDGTYEICLIVTNLAGADTACQNITVQGVGINEADAASLVSIYPNPTHGILNVQMGDNMLDNTIITITNTIGERVASRTARSAKEQFNMNGLAEGVYLVNITSNGQKVTKKFVYTH